MNRRYRNEIFNLTQKIYQLGIEKHESRSQSICEFNKAVEVGIKEAQIQGIKYGNWVGFLDWSCFFPAFIP